MWIRKKCLALGICLPFEIKKLSPCPPTPHPHPQPPFLSFKQDLTACDKVASNTEANLWPLFWYLLSSKSLSPDKNLLFLYICWQVIWQTGHLEEKEEKKEKKSEVLKVKEFICTNLSMCINGPIALSWLDSTTSYYCELLVRKLLVEVKTLPTWCWSAELNEEG